MDNTFYSIHHHGAINGVTGSCHELRFNKGPGILIDCGLFQGAETSANKAGADQLHIDFDIAHIQALIVTHVHIDHVGRIPWLLAAGFNGPIYTSEASAALLPLVLEDALKIGVTRNKRLIRQFMGKIHQQLRPIAYKHWQTIISDNDSNLRIKLQPAGHILGSAYAECDIRRFKQKHRIVFSGDLGAPHAPLLPAPRAPYQADTLIIESTYGDRQHEGRRLRRQRLKQVIERSLEDRGAILIPAFSIGRTQEILYELETLIHESHTDRASKSKKTNLWNTLEIIVDSPLAARFTEQYRELQQHWDKEALQRLRRGRHPLSFEQLYTVENHDQHITAVNYIKSTGHPCIVIAASGMCAGGRITNYLKALIEDSRTNILFIGYQAAGTPGRDIQTWGPRGGYVMLDDKKYTIKAKIDTLGGYSAHADQNGLINFVRRMRHKPQEIRIVHGDDKAKKTLANLYKHMGIKRVLIPEK